MPKPCESYLVALKPLLDKVPIQQYCKRPQELVDRLFKDYMDNLSWVLRKGAQIGLSALGDKKEKWFKTARVLFWKLNQDPEFIDSCQQNNTIIIKQKIMDKLLQLQDYITACTGKSKNETRKLNAVNMSNFNAGKNAVVANLALKKISIPTNRSIHNNANAIVSPSASQNNLTVVGSVGSDPRPVASKNTASTVSVNSHVGNNRSANNRPGNNHVANNRSANNRPGNNHVANNRPGNNHVANNHVANNRPGNNRTANNRPGNNHVANNRTANNRTANNRTANNRSGNNRSGNNRTEKNRSGNNRSGNNRLPNNNVFIEENNNENNINNNNFQTARSGTNNNRGLNNVNQPQFNNNNNNTNLIKNFKPQNKWVK
jgi:hypothetical protein